MGFQAETRFRTHDLKKKVIIGIDECHPPPSRNFPNSPFVYVASISFPDQPEIQIKKLMPKGHFFGEQVSSSEDTRLQKVQRAYNFLQQIPCFRYAVVQPNNCSFRDERGDTLADLVYTMVRFAHGRFARQLQKNSLLVVVDGEPFWRESELSLDLRLSDYEEEFGNLQKKPPILFQNGADNMCYAAKIADATAYALAVIHASHPKGKWPYRKLMVRGPGKSSYANKVNPKDRRGLPLSSIALD